VVIGLVVGLHRVAEETEKGREKSGNERGNDGANEETVDRL
jgi:hypothetical protein